MNNQTSTLRDSAAMRWLVLLLLAFAMFCSYIFMDILSPIKVTQFLRILIDCIYRMFYNVKFIIKSKGFLRTQL